ncbi:UNVERIFIED_CONTAM: hypothetical protein Slati_2977200 [Sesamum latifolium]|uniref:Retroviral polymerase SH3-like domain-containing protein n=1 Tax=Sesamum latifolium TaxID=2727402 RepID=A0AAW2VGC0_9LAMI
MDIDYAIRKAEPAPITKTSQPDEVDLYKKWERPNRLSVMFIKTKISASIRGNSPVPTKMAVSKTPFELFKGRKPSLRHVRIWGCPSEVRVYNPQEKKLDPRTISGYFVEYAERSKGYKFYCPSNSTRIVESRNAKFLEDDLISGSDKGLSIRSNLDHSESQPSTSSNGLIFVVHNTPTVQTRVEQPIQTVPQVDALFHIYRKT